MKDCVSGSVEDVGGDHHLTAGSRCPANPHPVADRQAVDLAGEGLWQRGRCGVAQDPPRAIEQQHGAMGAGITVLDTPAQRVQRPIERVPTHDPGEHPLLVLEIGLDQDRRSSTPLDTLLSRAGDALS